MHKNFMKRIVLITIFFYGFNIMTMMISDSERYKKIYNIYNNKMLCAVQECLHSPQEKNFYQESINYLHSFIVKKKDEYEEKFSLLTQKFNDIGVKKIPIRYAVKFLHDCHFLKEKYVPIVFKYQCSDFQSSSNRCLLFNRRYRQCIYSISKNNIKNCNNYFKAFVLSYNKLISIDNDRIFSLIRQALKKGDLAFVDFLIHPEIVNFLNKHGYAYDPNFLWKYVLNNDESFIFSLESECYYEDIERLDYRGAVARLLMRYKYLQDIDITNMQEALQSSSRSYKYESLDVCLLLFSFLYKGLTEENKIKLIKVMDSIVYNDDSDSKTKDLINGITDGDNSYLIERLLNKKNICVIDACLKEFIEMEVHDFLDNLNNKVSQLCELGLDYEIQQEEWRNIELFKQRVVKDLLKRKKIYFRWLLTLLHCNKSFQEPLTEEVLIALICDKIYNQKRFDKTIDDDDHNYRSNVFKAIIKAGAKEEYDFIDFLINPTTVACLNEYGYVYNPNNFWQELLKIPREHMFYFKVVQYGQPISKEQKEWLEDKALKNEEKIVKLLIKHNYVKNISSFDFCHEGLPEICGGFKQTRYKKYYYSMNPLHVACKIGNSEILEMLLEYSKNNTGKLNINSLEAQGYTPIQYAAKRDITLVDKLINAGTDFSPCLFLSCILVPLKGNIDIKQELDKLEFFKKLKAQEQKAFIQNQLFLLASVYLPSYRKLLVNIDNILNAFIKSGANFYQDNKEGKFVVDIVQDALSLTNPEELCLYFAILRKISIRSTVEFFLTIRLLPLPADIIGIICKFYDSYVFKHRIYKKYADKLTDKQCKEMNEKKLKKLYNTINEELKSIAL